MPLTSPEARDTGPTARVSDEQRLSIARSIGIGHASYINADNLFVGTDSLTNAVASGRAYFVTMREDILALDFDDEATADAQARWAYALLRMAGLMPVILWSGGESRRHVFCRVSEAQAFRVLRPMGIGATDQRVRRTIRPPYTPHRIGNSASQPLLIGDPQEVIERLHHVGRRPLGRVAQGIFDKATSSDKSATIFSAALGAANAGWSFDEFLLALDCPEIPISRVFLARVEDRGKEATVEWLRNQVWTQAVAQVSAYPAVRQSEVDPAVRSTLAWVLDQRWQSMQGTIDRSVAAALLWGRRRAGRVVFDMSEREIALVAGVSRSAVQASLARLQRLLIEGEPFLSRQRVEDARQRVHLASSWRLHSVPTDASVSPESFEQIIYIVGHDVFRNNGGLGTSSRLIYLTLTYRGMLNLPDLVERTGLSDDTVRRHLRSLETEGLIVKIDDEWSITDVPLASVSGLRSEGRALRQEEQYGRERHARDIGQRRRER